MPLKANWKSTAAPAVDDFEAAGASDDERDADLAELRAARSGDEISPYIAHIIDLAKRVDVHSSAAYRLKQHGVRVYSDAELLQLGPQLGKELLDSLKSAPEMQSDWYEKGEQAHLGGASFLGQPSTFHTPIVRKIRALVAKRHAKMAMEEGWFDGNTLATVHADRVAFRRGRTTEPGGAQVPRKMWQKPSGESYHQDVSPHRDSEDARILGGWIALDARPQKFRCVPGTAFSPTPELLDEQREWLRARGKTMRAVGGFAMFSLNAQEKAAVRRYTVDVEIPAYSIVAFDERIFHEVVGGIRETDLLRQFVSMQYNVRPDYADVSPLSRSQLLAARTQTVPMIKSGQFPDMMSSNHTAFGRLIARVQEWSDAAIAPAFKRRFEFVSGARKGQFKYNGVPRYIKKSLKEVPGAAQPEYSQEELDLFGVKKLSDY